MKQRTQPCLSCHGTGKVIPGFKYTRPGVMGGLVTDIMSTLSENKDERTVNSVDIPRKHARDAFIAVSIVSGAGCWLAGGDPARSAAWSLLLSTISAGAVRWLASVGDWNLLWWRVEQLANIDLTGDGAIGEPETNQPPRKTAIDEIDERHANGAPMAASLTWLPISPEETQKLAVALVVDDVRLVRTDLVAADALPLNSYKAVVDELKRRRMAFKTGNRNRLSLVGYKWFCKKLPQGLTPLPYTSLR